MKTKTCSTCKSEKEIESFQLDSSKHDGLDCMCKDCRRQYRQKHKKETNERKLRWYKNNRNILEARTVAQKAFPVHKICSVEGCDEIGDRHHLDYAYPLEIIWLCKRHHYMAHRVINILSSRNSVMPAEIE